MTTDATQAVMFHGRAPEDRDPGAEVMRTWRAVSLTAAGMRPRLPPVEYAVLLAVHGLVVSWTRLWDEVYVADVAIVAGLTTGDGQPDAKECGRRLRSLAQRGLIVYQPSRVKGRPSRVGMPAVTAAGTLVGGGQAAPPKPASNPTPSDGVRGGQAAPPKTRNRGGQATPLCTEREREDSSSASTAAQPPLPPVSVGGGGTRLDDDTTRVVTEITRMVRGGPRSGLAIRGRVVELLAAGYTSGEITRHVHARTATARDRGIITSPVGLLRHVLDADDIPPALAQVAAERDAARQRDAIDRHQVATATGTTARREAIDEALGPVLRGRLVAAVIATSEVYQRSRRTPAFIAGLLDTTYAAHDHDVDRIRAHAETLPPVVSETPIPAPDTPVEPGPAPTHPDGTFRPSLADLEAAVAQRVGGAA